MNQIRKVLFVCWFLPSLCPVLRGEEPSSKPTGTTSSAPVSWPDTFAGRSARAFFQAAEAESDEPMRQWQQANRAPDSFKETPLEQRVARARSIREQLGPLEIGKVEADGDYVVVVIAKSNKLGLWMKFHFAFQKEAPHYLDFLQGMPTTPPDAASTTLDPSSTLAELTEQIRKRSSLPALATAIVKGDRIVDAAATGVRRMDQPEAVTLQDRFHIGSIGKSMTATMIAKLVEDGVLLFDATVGKVFADGTVRDEYKALTLEQLLQHRGGIKPYTEDVSDDAIPGVKGAGSPMQQRAAFAALVLNEEPMAPPGTIMIYSNAGYALAGQMAERASKKSWDELMQSRVFDPLGMKSSGVGWPATVARPSQPSGHFGNPPDLRVQSIDEYDLGHYLAPAGDIHCTIEDLARYAAFNLQGLRGRDGWLKAETIRRLHTPGGKEKLGYACGWVIEETPDGKRRHWHEGSAGTFYASIILVPDQNLAVVAAANAAVPLRPFVDQIMDWAAKRAAEPPTEGAAQPATSNQP